MNFTEEQQLFQNTVKSFSEKEVAPGAAQRDELERFDWGIFHKMGEFGLTGVLWPEKYNGIHADFTTFTIIVEELSRCCAASGMTLSVHVALVGWSIYTFGNEMQKENVLKPLAEGKKLGACCLTSSDFDRTEIRAKIRAEKTEDGSGYVLNGAKSFVIHSGEADIYIVFALTNPQLEDRGYSAFIVEKGTPGLYFGNQERKLGIRSSVSSEMILEQCRIPAANMLGQEGDGLTIASGMMEIFRTAVAAQALGIARGAFEAAATYAHQRVQFGKPIAQHQGVSFKLAELATQIESARLLIYETAAKIDAGEPFSLESAMAKCFASQTAAAVTTEAVQIFGGYGYMKEYNVERFMRDAKSTEIFGGTNEMLRDMIAHVFIREESGVIL